MVRILKLKNFCSQIDVFEKIVKDDPQALQFISQYMRGHKGPFLEYDQDGFWRDLDAHLVFYDSNRLKRGSDNIQPGIFSIDQEDATLLKHIKVLKKGKTGAPKYRTAIKALGFSPDPKLNASKAKSASEDSKKGRGVCFNFRDKGECQFGSKCRFSHASNQINRAKEERVSLNVFTVNLATNESDQALMVAKRSRRADHDLDTSTNSLIDTYDDLDNNHDMDHD